MLNRMDEANRLLDFKEKLDITLLDSVVSCMYNGLGEQQKQAEIILNQLKEHPDAWTIVDAILEYAQNQQSKYFGLQILEKIISTRWRALPRAHCENIRKYIVSLIIKLSSQSTNDDVERVYLRKLNFILVQILKREWPLNWNSFIGDIVGASRTSESMCLNNMHILALLSEELFDYSYGRMTQTKIRHMKQRMCSEFSEVFKLCLFILKSSNSAQLVLETLKTLMRFFNWIPYGYIFQTELISLLIFKFLSVPMFRNVSLQCLSEIAQVKLASDDANLLEECHKAYLTIITETIKQLQQILPFSVEIRKAYANGDDSDQQFILHLSLFLSALLSKISQRLEEKDPDTLGHALRYLLHISDVDDMEIFKICLETWNSLLHMLFSECSTAARVAANCAQTPAMHASTAGGGGGGGHSASTWSASRRYVYAGVLSQLRVLMIGRMAKPEEVLVVTTEQGEVVREFMRDTDAIELYISMREALVYLTNLDNSDTERILNEKLQRQVDGTEWSWNNLNKLCWAIGSISGALHEEHEKRFLVTVIRDLLGLCEKKRGKENKAIIASNIMYVVGQYPRFLRAHWKFLKTVVNKLFEFMHETHEGVQDMACDTFIKITQKCRKQFVTVQIGELWPFIEEILSSINTHICDLKPQQVHTFYEAVGYMIAAYPFPSVQERLIEKYMTLPNHAWDDLLSQAKKNSGMLCDEDTLKQLSTIIKTNVRACTSTGHAFVAQLGKLYMDLLNLYMVLSDNFNAAVNLNGESVTSQSVIKMMRLVRKEILNFISVWISRSNDDELVLNNFVPALFDMVLVDYQRSKAPCAREPEVLNTITTIVNKLSFRSASFISLVFDAVFEQTMSMIDKDLQEFPEHRVNFFRLLKAINEHCFSTLVALGETKFERVVHAILFACKHTMREVCDLGLEILHKLLKNVSEDQVVCDSFHRKFHVTLLLHLFTVVTDSSHTAHLAQHATILSHMFCSVEQGAVGVPLDPAVVPAAAPQHGDKQRVAAENVTYLRNYLHTSLKTSFPHFTDNQVKVLVEGLFVLDQNFAQFREHLRDLLVQIKEYTGDDADLYLDERESEMRKAQEEKRKISTQVPGLLTPYEICDEMCD